MNNITIEKYGDAEIPHELQLRSDIGGREEQQDSAFIYAAPAFTFAIVCDGMGGTENGAMASRIALDTMRDLIREFISKQDTQNIVEFLRDAMVELDDRVFRELGRKKGGTTAVAAVICGDSLYWFSAGDSRLYILRNGELVQATRDHNYFLRLNEQLQRGEIDQARYNQEAARGEALISYIGMGGLTVFDLTSTPLTLLKGDILLLTSDGLYKAIPHELIAYILNSKTTLPRKADRLISQIAVLKQTATLDNTTFALIQI